MTDANNKCTLILVDTYAKVLDALGDPTRRALLELLRHAPRSVGTIATELPVSQPAVSQHLKVLREAGLVAMRRHGTSRIYRVDPAGLVPLRAYLDSFWHEALGAFAAAADAQADERADEVAGETVGSASARQTPEGGVHAR